MDRWVFSFITVCVFSTFWHELPSSEHLIAFTGILTATFLATYLWPKHRKLYQFLSGALCAILWVASVGHWYLSWQLPLSQINDIKRVEGTIDSVVTTNTDVRFVFSMNSWKTHDGKMHTAQSLLARLFGRPRIQLFWSQPPCELKSGQALQLEVRLKVFRNLANQGSFDAVRWATSRKLKGRGTVSALVSPLCDSQKTSLRQYLIDQLVKQKVSNTPWLLALTFGDRSLLNSEQWNLAQRHGISHLIAISGLHISVVMGGVFWFSQLIISSLNRCLVIRQRQRLIVWQLLITLIAGLFYAYLAGFGDPVTRAWLMLAVATTMIVCGRRLGLAKITLYSVFIMLLINPLVLLSSGVWLSYLAVCCVCFSLWRFRLITRDWQGNTVLFIVVQCVLSLLMTPTTGFLFGAISATSVLVNLFAIPIVSMLLVPVCLLAALATPLEFVSSSLFAFADGLLTVCLSGLTQMANIEWAYFHMPEVSLISVLSMSFLVTILLFPLNKLQKSGIVLCICAYCFSLISVTSEPKWRLSVLDVGHGLAIVISRDGRALIYDTGAAFPSGFNMADAVIKPYMRKAGIQHLERVVISHYDNDHAGALTSLLLFDTANTIPVISPKSSCFRGQHFLWNGLSFSALWPLTANDAADENHHSCVLMVSDGRYRVLLTGDIDMPTEQYLSMVDKQSLKADVLLAPHHGSQTSSSEALIELVKPRWVVYSHGQRKGWNFPAQSVVNRYWQNNVYQLSTFEDGQLTFEFPEKENAHVVVHRFNQAKTQKWYSDLFMD